MKAQDDRPTQPAPDGRVEHLQAPLAATKPLLVRLPEGVLATLKEEAARDGSSVNSIVVSILKHHASWDRHQKRLGFMPMHKSMILAMLDKMTMEEIEAIGRKQKDQTVRDFLVFHSTYSLETFLKWIDLRCRVLGFQLMTRRGTLDTLNIVIHHDMGQKWSFYYKGMFSAVLQDLLPKGSTAAFDTGDSSFALTITGVKAQDE